MLIDVFFYCFDLFVYFCIWFQLIIWFIYFLLLNQSLISLPELESQSPKPTSHMTIMNNISFHRKTHGKTTSFTIDSFTAQTLPLDLAHHIENDINHHTTSLQGHRTMFACGRVALACVVTKPIWDDYYIPILREWKL